MALSEQELVDAAVAVGMLSVADLEDARGLARRNRLPLISAVSRQIRRPVSAIYQAAAERRGIPFASPSSLVPDEQDMKRMPRGLALRRQCLPVRGQDGVLSLVMANPDDVNTLEQVTATLAEDVRPSLAFPAALSGAIERCLGEDIAESLGADDATSLLEEIMIDAFMEQASDIHFQPVDRHLRVRYRVDGMLRDWRRDLRPAERDPLVNRIKVLADLDIAESRAPQDGSFRQRFADFDDAQVEVRVSTLPVHSGERVVLRLLGTNPDVTNLNDLGLGQALLHDFHNAIEQPHGVVLVTGPTGSGKSTTLYAALREIDRVTHNVITVEDPIEQLVDGASQVQVATKIGFSSALRSILRQDPDVILIGEIRDGETADIALKAAQTGHLVFSTLHTNTAIGAITRLADLGVGRWQVSASLHGVISQRLVPCLCDKCRTPRKATEGENLALMRDRHDDTPIFDPRGCAFCLGTGFSGRAAVFETLWIDGALRDMISSGASEADLERAASGFNPLRHDLAAKVIDGTTSFKVARSLGLEPVAPSGGGV